MKLSFVRHTGYKKDCCTIFRSLGNYWEVLNKQVLLFLWWTPFALMHLKLGRLFNGIPYLLSLYEELCFSGCVLYSTTIRCRSGKNSLLRKRVSIGYQLFTPLLLLL